MQNLKVKVNTLEESKEAQQLFLKYGATGNVWLDQSIRYVCIFNGVLVQYDFLPSVEFKQITLAELREMVNQEQDEPFLTPECTLNNQVRQHQHYFKDVSNLDEIDVYMVLKLFNVTDPCLQHIAKKALCAGQRGHKNFQRDLQDILDTAKRAVEINKNC